MHLLQNYKNATNKTFSAKFLITLPKLKKNHIKFNSGFEYKNNKYAFSDELRALTYFYCNA